MKKSLLGLVLLLILAAVVFILTCREKFLTENSKLDFVPVKKFALLIGISDQGTKWAGNDVQFMAELAGVRDKGPDQIVTTSAVRCAKPQILKQLSLFAEKAVSGNYVYIYFSCHGMQVTDSNHDEMRLNSGDDKDEALLLYNKELLLDDELDSAFNAFAVGVRIVFVADCCHSGSMYSLTKLLAFDFVPEVSDTSLKAEMIYLGACQDDRLAKGNDARTYSEFTKNLWGLGRNNQNKTWYALLSEVAGSLENIQLPVYVEKHGAGICRRPKPTCNVIDPSFRNQIAFKF